MEGPGLYLRTGAFVTHVRSAIRSVAAGIGLLYADYPLAEEDFADFHVSLDRPANLRRWYRPQVLFHFDGKSPFKPLPLEQAFPMFEWGLNWCVSAHVYRYLIIHAAVVERGGRAAVLPAPPGSGKSTLCAALVSRGWRLLSDELTLIGIDDGKIHPLPRPVSLKNASIDIIKAYVPGSVFSPTVMDTTKGSVAHMKPTADSVRRVHEKARPGWVIFPQYQPDAAPELLDLPRSRALLRVAENAFNFNALGTRGFEVLADTIDASLCFEFTYSRLDDAVAVFDSLEAEARAAL
ncbi:HprK-related kinase A [Noviherbaspirillum denitrificans]|nr:HprK-related kinase A [Noviherbaspirillum denitrificans]